MASPPRDPFGHSSPGSPGGTSSSQAFIYPIRAAVSVRAPPSEDGSSRSSKTGTTLGNSSRAGNQDVVELRNTDLTRTYSLGSSSSFAGDDSGSEVGSTGTTGTGDIQMVADKRAEVLSRLRSEGMDPEEAHDHRKKTLMTTRFKHIETPEGHMVVTGQEGLVTRCEDEPIHIPGAIQSFGCMMVVREDDDGELVVRQASENSYDVLGLSPAYLFTIPSLLDVLDDDQVDVLWDNIDSLNASEKDLTESGPHVFQIHGWGEPGSARDNPRKDSAKCDPGGRRMWDCWCAAHQPDREPDQDGKRPLIVLEFELVRDEINPLSSQSDAESVAKQRGHQQGASISTLQEDGRTVSVPARRRVRGGLEGEPYEPTAEQLAESTQPTSRPLQALARMRRAGAQKGRARRRARDNDEDREAGATPIGQTGMLDMFGVLSQANEQLSAQTDLQAFLKVAVSIMRDITGFSRVMVYQFDEAWNGQVVCELVDWNDTHDLFRGLHFPASDIPKQARDLYRINKVRLLYDRDQSTARMVCREVEDLERPVDMTHAYLRAMSPIHLKYLTNMGVRASMSISVLAFDQLWGLMALHNYGEHGKRVSFPVRQLSRLLGDSISRNIERLSYARRLSARKLINTLPTDQNPGGYIISNAEDLLALFDADFGVIAIGHEAKILGPLSASQEVLAVTEYLRIKKFTTVMTSQAVSTDFPDMILPKGLEVIAGLLLVPLSSRGIDFIAFLRKGQLRHVNWAGKPFKEGKETAALLEPRKSFKVWSETVLGKCRSWKDEELETASVLCLVYGKFISVWRQREQALQYNQLNRLLLSNASHEVRTPLNHIINYLELALDGQLDQDTRDNLSRSHMASKSLLFVINDLLDLTRQEQGNKLFLQEPFDLSATIREAVEMHEWEARRRKVEFSLKAAEGPCLVVGDKNRIRQVVINTVTNSIKATERGRITVEMRQLPPEEMHALPEDCDIEVELAVSDTGVGIPREKLENIFREFEQVESVIAVPNQEGETPKPSEGGLGLGLAIVARIVRNLGGQLRVDSTVDEGSKFTYYIPFKSAETLDTPPVIVNAEPRSVRRANSRGSASSGGKSEIDSLVEAISSSHMDGNVSEVGASRRRKSLEGGSGPKQASALPVPRPVLDRIKSHDGSVQITGSAIPLRSVKMDEMDDRSLDMTSPPATISDKHNGPPSLTPGFEVPSFDASPSPSVPGDGEKATIGRPIGRKRIDRVRPASPSLMKEKLSRLRILVVEDDPINRMILKKRLGMDGHHVSLAVNGEEGVHQFEKEGAELDVILMDLQMPICNGQDACRRIRECESTQKAEGKQANRPAAHVLNGRVPIFAVSATLYEGMRQEMTEIGMDGWLLKPIDFVRLNALLKGLTHPEQRESDQWKPGCAWERGGWLSEPAPRLASTQITTP